MVKIRPTSLGLFCSKDRSVLMLALSLLHFVCAAALTDERPLTYGDVVGGGTFEIALLVDLMTPSYLRDCKSIAYLFLSIMLAWYLKSFSVSGTVGMASNRRSVRYGFSCF